MLRSTVTALGLCCLLLEAQTKVPPAPADYGQWEALVPSRASGLSPDGKWLAYGITRANGQNELRVAKIADASTKAYPFAAQPAFSADSHWLAYSIGYSESQQEKMRQEKKPVRNQLGLTNLLTGEQTVIDNIQSFAFSPSGTWLAMRGYGPEKTGAGPAADASSEDESISGAPLLVRNLATGRDTALANASEYVWQDLALKSHLLAVATSSEDKTGNGIQIFDTETASLRTLDSSASVYSGLAWRKDSSDLAALRSKTDDKHDGPGNVALAWTHLGDPAEAVHRYDGEQGFPANMRIVSARRPAWSADGADVFIGIAAWDMKPPKKAAKGDDEELPAVDVWHWRDADVMPKQKKSAAQDRRKNMLAVWHVEQNQFVQLGHELTGQVTPLKHQKTAYATEWKAYAMDRSIGRPAADLYLVDLATGNSTKIKERLTDDRYLQASPGGHYLLYLQNDHYWTVNTATHAIVDITKNVKTPVIDTESDDTIKQLPPFGIAGWTKDDKEVIVYDKFDLWKVASDGSKATKLTDGAADQTRFRYVKLDPDEEFIDTDKPIYLSMFGIWSKKSGYARLEGGQTERLIWADKSVDRLAKA